MSDAISKYFLNEISLSCSYHNSKNPRIIFIYFSSSSSSGEWEKELLFRDNYSVRDDGSVTARVRIRYYLYIYGPRVFDTVPGYGLC